MATGRSDYPNQVNNVLGFPFIFRGALDVYASAINEEMKQAAAYALAKLAKEEVPESVKRAYGAKVMTFGREYIIPKPFDPRVLTWVAPAVAQAAMDTGVARKPIADFDEYRHSLDIRMGRAQVIMTPIYHKAQSNPKRVVLPEGHNPRIIKAAQLAVDEGIAKPILVGDEKLIRKVAEDYHYDIEGVEIINPASYAKTPDYVKELFRLRQRKGTTLESATNRMQQVNFFGSMMVHMGDADAMISGITSHYPWTLRPALKIIGRDPNYNKVSGMYIVNTKRGTYFLADTSVNVDPDAQGIADIALQAADFVTNFDITPRVALLSYSNFGAVEGETPQKMSDALEIIRARNPKLIVDGEIQADTALSYEKIKESFPFSTLDRAANVLIFPNLDSGNIAVKLLNKLGEARIIGPVLQGLSKSVHVLQRGSDVNEILDMIAIAVVDAQHKEDKAKK
jgi:malate dehydrogenase (oxaloacetate-decarboxylating)(NADP+)